MLTMSLKRLEWLVIVLFTIRCSNKDVGGLVLTLTVGRVCANTFGESVEAIIEAISFFFIMIPRAIHKVDSL